MGTKKLSRRQENPDPEREGPSGAQPSVHPVPPWSCLHAANTSRWPFPVPGTAVRPDPIIPQGNLRDPSRRLSHLTGEERGTEGLVAVAAVCLLAKDAKWQSQDSNPTSLASESTLLPGMFPAVSPPFEAWPQALLSSLGSLPEPSCTTGRRC